MAKKRSIHELIEEQEPEAKQRMWDEVRQRIAQEDILGEGTPTCKKFSWKKIATIAASFVLVLGIILFYAAGETEKSLLYPRGVFFATNRGNDKKTCGN